MPEHPARVVDAEVVPTGARRDAERVKVSRIPAGALYRGVFQSGASPEVVHKRVRELQVRLWLWLGGFAVIAAACVYGAVVTDIVIWSAFLLIAGFACAVACSLVWLVIWAIRRVPLPPLH